MVICFKNKYNAKYLLQKAPPVTVCGKCRNALCYPVMLRIYIHAANQDRRLPAGDDGNISTARSNARPNAEHKLLIAISVLFVLSWGESFAISTNTANYLMRSQGRRNIEQRPTITQLSCPHLPIGINWLQARSWQDQPPVFIVDRLRISCPLT